MDSMQPKYELIGAHLGWGAQLFETEQGPKALKEAGLLSACQVNGLKIDWRQDIFSQLSASSTKKLSYHERLEQISNFSQSLAEYMQVCVRNMTVPIVLGGDHATAIGSWSGIISAHQAEQAFGLIWVDAHMDAHTPQSSHSGAIHGMPLAVLLGYGESELVQCQSPIPKLNPAHVVLIGIRSFEKEEQAFLEQLGVKYYTMDKVSQLGFAQCLKEAHAIVSNDTKGFGLTIDLDSFDPSDAPGVGSPESNGIQAQEALLALEGFGHNSGFVGLEIAEYNPTRDKEGMTEQLVEELIKRIFYVKNT